MAKDQLIDEKQALNKKQIQHILKGLELLKKQQERRLNAEDDQDMKGLFIRNIMETTQLINAMEEMKGQM